ncbi:MAG TPA: hypothetical protein VIX82_14350 [Solirubrobacteraceae bacterium]
MKVLGAPFRALLFPPLEGEMNVRGSQYIRGMRCPLMPDAGVFRDKPAETLGVIRNFILSE